MRPLLFSLALGLAPLSPAPLWAGDPTVDFITGDAEMSAAETEAQANLDRFLAHALNGAGLGRPNADLKVAFPVTGHGNAEAEVIWVSRFKRDAGGFSGELSNEPNAMPGLHLGDRVTFTRDQIRDWGWMDGASGKLYGHYTTRVITRHLPPEQAAPLLELLSPQPVPSGW